MNQSAIIEKTVDFVKETLSGAEGGHDWWHIYRVWNNAKYIAGFEHADLFIVEMGALLHDIADSKFNDGDESIGPRKAEQFLKSQNVGSNDIEHIIKIIENISFKVSRDGQIFKSPELDVIQDADRLDAIGAIGIARAFNYGGFKNREIYTPGLPPNLNFTKDEYKKNTAPTINHFYEKLLLLKNLMNTKTGREIAENRHKFMETFLEQFYKEWNDTI